MLIFQALLDWGREGPWGAQVVVDTVHTEQEFKEAVRSRAYDIVIADYVLPSYSAPEAYEWALTNKITTPFIVVTGAQDDQSCVTLLRRGVADYLRKDRLARLGASVERTVERARLFARMAERDKADDTIQAQIEEVLAYLKQYRQQLGDDHA